MHLIHLGKDKTEIEDTIVKATTTSLWADLATEKEEALVDNITTIKEIRDTITTTTTNKIMITMIDNIDIAHNNSCTMMEAKAHKDTENNTHERIEINGLEKLHKISEVTVNQELQAEDI